MKKSLYLGASMLALSAGSVFAADVYSGGMKDGPAYIGAPGAWTGFYIGANAGYGWADRKKFNADFTQAHDGPVNFNGGKFDGIDLDGGFGGGQIGYNLHLPNSVVVIGIEADIQGAGWDDSGKTAFRTAPAAEMVEGPRTTLATVNYDSKLDWFGTIRGRVGLVQDRTLVYLTGGFAYANLEHKIAVVPGGPSFKTEDDTATGYVIGGGIEHKLNPAWSVKAEYLYMNLGKNEPEASVGYASAVANSLGAKLTVRDDDYHTLRVGLNYHVGNGYEPIK